MMRRSEFHLEQGVLTARASDRLWGIFAYHCAKVVRINVLDAGTKEVKPGSLALAEQANLSRDWIEDHAIAFRLLVALFQAGLSEQAKYYWRKLYKSHWITAATSWRKHQDIELALSDLETYDTMNMNPDEAKKAKKHDPGVVEILSMQRDTLDRQLEKLQGLADKQRGLLPYVQALRKAYGDHYLPALENTLEAIQRQERVEQLNGELGFKPGWIGR